MKQEQTITLPEVTPVLKNLARCRQRHHEEWNLVYWHEQAEPISLAWLVEELNEMAEAASACGLPDLVCNRCGAPVSLDPSWHTLGGDEWEHKCRDVHSQCGHVGVGVERDPHSPGGDASWAG